MSQPLLPQSSGFWQSCSSDKSPTPAPARSWCHPRARKRPTKFRLEARQSLCCGCRISENLVGLCPSLFSGYLCAPFLSFWVVRCILISSGIGIPRLFFAMGLLGSRCSLPRTVRSTFLGEAYELPSAIVVGGCKCIARQSDHAECGGVPIKR